MAPQRQRARRGRSRWLRVQYIRQPGNLDGVTIAGERTRKVGDIYCPFCATDIRAAASRRLTRCPNTNLCGKPLPIDEETCPNCTHYIRSTDNFCRICRTNLRSTLVRGRGGLFLSLNRVPSPLRSSSPPRPQQPQVERSDSDSDDDDDNDDDDNDMNGGGNVPQQLNAGGGGQPGGFLRVVAIDD